MRAALTVLIATADRPRLLDATIRSVLTSAAAAPDVETSILVVDDSEAGTAAETAARHPVAYVRNPVRDGLLLQRFRGYMEPLPGVGRLLGPYRVRLLRDPHPLDDHRNHAHGHFFFRFLHRRSEIAPLPLAFPRAGFCASVFELRVGG